MVSSFLGTTVEVERLDVWFLISFVGKEPARKLMLLAKQSRCREIYESLSRLTDIGHVKLDTSDAEEREKTPGPGDVTVMAHATLMRRILSKKVELKKSTVIVDEFHSEVPETVALCKWLCAHAESDKMQVILMSAIILDKLHTRTNYPVTRFTERR